MRQETERLQVDSTGSVSPTVQQVSLGAETIEYLLLNPYHQLQF